MVRYNDLRKCPPCVSVKTTMLKQLFLALSSNPLWRRCIGFPTLYLEATRVFPLQQSRAVQMRERAVAVVFDDICFRFLHSLRIMQPFVERYLPYETSRSLAGVYLTFNHGSNVHQTKGNKPYKKSVCAVKRALHFKRSHLSAICL